MTSSPPLETMAGERPAGRSVVRNHGRRAWNALTCLVFPNVCPACMQPLDAPDSTVCANCRRELHSLPTPRCRRCGGALDGVLDACPQCLQANADPPWTVAVSALVFEGFARVLVHRFKYRRHTFLAPVFVGYMVRAWEEHGGLAIDAVVPVPLHWTRQVHRGYNQSELLAGGIAATLHRPLRRVLKRSRRTPQQARLDIEHRTDNVAGAFRIARKAAVKDQRILLIDDVHTTGATLREAARELLHGGAADVGVLTAAKG